MTSRELALIVEGKLIGSQTAKVKGFEFDSRKVNGGTVFVPLKGKRDGHQFIEDAVKRGAIGYFTEKEIPLKAKFSIKVTNTLDAFLKVAKFKRDTFKGKVIGITGSVGKTTTKELLRFVLSEHYGVYTNVESFNNEIGISYTLSNIPEDAEILIQEVGANKPGEISFLSKIVKPNVGIITAIGESHLEGFECIENIIEEKLTLLDHSSVAILPSPLKPKTNIPTVTFGSGGDVELTDVIRKSESSEFKVRVKDKYYTGKVNVPGSGILNSVMIALALSDVFGISIKVAMKKIEEFKPPKWRLNVKELKRGITLINDSYNANPVSMKNALEVLSRFKKKKVAILGDMLELGKQSERKHKEIGNFICKCGIDMLLTFGNRSRFYGHSFNGLHLHFDQMEELLEFTTSFNFEGSAILVKGSRGNRLETVAKLLEDLYENRSS